MSERSGAELIDDLQAWRVVPDRLRHWVSTRPDEPFVRCGGDWLSFAEVDRRSGALAGALAARGVGKGDRVALVLPNREETLVTIFALARLGAIQVPVNVFLKGEFLRYQLADSQACALIADRAGVTEADRLRESLPELRTVIQVGGIEVGEDGDGPGGAERYDDLLAEARAAPEVQIAPPDIMAILYTSGTTGMPKGCMLSHGYYMSLTWPWYVDGWYRPDDRIITATPMFHISGQGIALMGALLGGIPVSYESTFSASSFIDRVREAGATVAYGVGPMAMAMLAAPQRSDERDHGLRFAVFMPMPPEAQQRFEERFGVPLGSEIYGQSECTNVTKSACGEPRRTPGCIGRPVELLFEVDVVDDDDNPVADEEIGELVVRPRRPLVMFSGYWRKPEATVGASRNLWHHTGDYVRRHADGFLTFVDRKKDSMRRRGENISSAELEAAIARHPAVAEVAVHGVPSPLGEDDVKAWLVLEPGAQVEPASLHTWFVQHLPYFAVPRYVQLTEALPVNALGRIQKFELRELDNAAAWDLEALGLVVDRSARR